MRDALAYESLVEDLEHRSNGHGAGRLPIDRLIDQLIDHAILTADNNHWGDDTFYVECPFCHTDCDMAYLEGCPHDGWAAIRSNSEHGDSKVLAKCEGCGALYPRLRDGWGLNALPTGEQRTSQAQGSDFGRLALSTDQVKDLPPPKYLVEQYLVSNSLARVYRPSGGGKTFLVIDWGLSIGSGVAWNGHEIREGGGPVLYVIAEGAGGIGKRLDSWEVYNGIRVGKDAVSWLPMAVNLSDSREVAALCRYVEHREFVFIAFDTQARCTPGVEENSTKEMGIVVANLDRIRQASGACVMLVHHTGVSDPTRGRGSSAVRAALDTELELTDNDGGRLTLKVKKQKDGPEASPINLDRMVYGESCVLTPGGRSLESGLTDGAVGALAMLKSIQVPGGVSSSVWRASLPDIGDRTFYKYRAQLVKMDCVVNVGNDRAPRYLVADADTARSSEHGRVLHTARP